MGEEQKQTSPDGIIRTTETRRPVTQTPGGTPLYGLYRYVQPKGYGFSAVVVIDRVSILANFGHFGHKWGMVFAL